MASAINVLEELKGLADPEKLDGMAGFGMSVAKRLGISIPVLRSLAKKIGRNHALALTLWKSGYAEARILASMIAEPEELTGKQIAMMVRDFDSWDVCDQVCMNLFEHSTLACSSIEQWATSDEEFVRRAAFALIACLAWHDKSAPDSQFIRFLGLVRQAALDDRNFVKKSVNWALRNIGKRSLALNKKAIIVAKEIQKDDSKSARWIAADALRELSGEKTLERIKRTR